MKRSTLRMGKFEFCAAEMAMQDDIFLLFSPWSGPVLLHCLCAKHEDFLHLEEILGGDFLYIGQITYQTQQLMFLLWENNRRNIPFYSIKNIFFYEKTPKC
jgi:hypothetical protein